MEPEKRRESLEVVGVAAIVSVAVLLGLVFKGVSGETVLDAVKDIGGVMVPILAAVLAASLVTREMDPSERFLRKGEDALRAVQGRHPKILSGPKASRESYDPDNPGKAGRYLFCQREGKGRKAQLIPVLPLREGIVEVRVSKTTLLVCGFPAEMPEDAAQRVRSAVKVAVEERLRSRWTDAYETLEHKASDIAIVVDFDEGKMGPRKFAKAVEDCAEVAFAEILKASRSSSPS